MNFPKLYFLLLIDCIGFFNPSLSLKYEARKYNCPRGVRNGSIKQLKSRGKVSCNFGYKLFGQRYVWCDGRHKGPLPVCIRMGCAPPTEPNHGTWLFSRNDALGTLQCDDGYDAGDDVHIFCDGHVWSSVGQRPTCSAVVYNPNTTCDFEDPDLCGWTQDFYHDDFDWRRQNFGTPSGHLHTGPSFDHSFGIGFAGSYMYIEASSPRMSNETARLYSPIYPANYSENACFIFWYHMYGATMGSLNVHVLKKGESLAGTSAVFSLSGNQGNLWQQALVPLDPQDSQFQIVLEGVVGHGYEGDAAVDDVKLGHGVECLPSPRPAPTTPSVSGSASAAFTEATGFEVSKEGADNSSLNFSPLVPSGPEVFLSTPDEGQIIYSIPSSTSVKSPTLDTGKSQTLFTESSNTGSSSFETIPPTEIPTLNVANVTSVIPIGSEQPQRLTTAIKDTGYTFVNFTDTQSSLPVTSLPIQTVSTRLNSDGAALNTTFRTATDFEVTSRATLANFSNNKTTVNRQTTLAPTSSLATNYTGKEILTKFSSNATTSVPVKSSPVTYFTNKVTAFKQFATVKTTSVPVNIPQYFNSYVKRRKIQTSLIRSPPPRFIKTSTKIFPKYSFVKTTPTVVKRVTLPYITAKTTVPNLETQTTPPVPTKAPSPAPSSRRNSAYQFLTSKLQQYMSPNQTPARSKVPDSSGGSVGATIGIALAGAVATLGAVFLAVRLARRRLARKLQSREPEDSDVRFLTSDEILDFNMARPTDCDL